MPFLASLSKLRGTSTNFNKFKAKPIPPAPARTILKHSEPPREDKEDDDETKRNDLDDKIDKANDNDGPSSGDKKPKQVAPSKAVHNNEADEEEHASHAVEADDSYLPFWNEETAYEMQPVEHTDTNYWTPSAQPMFKMLREIESMVAGSANIAKHHPEFFFYQVAVYLSVLFYIQIFRAQKAAGKLVGLEKSILKRFLDNHKEGSLAIPAPFVPFFNTIISTEPADRKYKWVVPRVAEGLISSQNNMGTGATAADRRTATRAYFNHDQTRQAILYQPYLPAMLSMAMSFSRSTAAQLGQNIDDDLVYTPNEIDHTAGNDNQLFGIEARLSDNDATTQHEFRWFLALGLNYPMTFYNQNYTHACREMRRSTFGRAYDTGEIHPIEHNNCRINVKTIETFLRMEKTSNIDWFEPFKKAGITCARFFGPVVFLKDINTTGGEETLVICRLFNERITGTADNARPEKRYTYDNADLTRTPANVDWYFNPFLELRGKFTSNRANLQQANMYQAITFGTNQILPIYAADNGAEEIYLQSEQHDGQIGAFREGRIFGNKEWSIELYNEPGSRGKPMYRNWNSAVYKKLFRETPHGVKRFMIDEN